MATSVDPVCGMELDPGQNEAQTRYRGQRYDFCSEECKRLFDANPEQYLDVPPKEAQDTAPPVPRP